jgi:hypothetical protein
MSDERDVSHGPDDRGSVLNITVPRMEIDGLHELQQEVRCVDPWAGVACVCRRREREREGG